MGEILARIMKESGLLAGEKQSELIRAWCDVAGPSVTAHATVRSFRGGVLTIAVESASLRQELQVFQREELLAALRERLRSVFLEDLRFTLI